ncbi:hypothetical protein V474_16945 [Novosphingobium barchaimii LL02]|uniref:Uncharacterized protein n=2 Tax=Novosphingobium barchaimii TaxID=1420591 RepID=A0A0J8ALI6_9SPHN|nr:hypothetical protein V474_16945 [Novosphingobium barchaimii LL02]
MFRRMMAVLVMTAPTAPLAAQDIAPIISPGQAAEGIFNRSRMEEQARRQREGKAAQVARPAALTRQDIARQKRFCDNRPALREKYGSDDARILKLDSLCAAAGY